jgi:hypothetical protein
MMALPGQSVVQIILYEVCSHKKIQGGGGGDLIERRCSVDGFEAFWLLSEGVIKNEYICLRELRNGQRNSERSWENCSDHSLELQDKYNRNKPTAIMDTQAVVQRM